MKFIQLLLCFIVVTSLFLEINAIQSSLQSNLIRRHKKKQITHTKQKNIIDWLFGKWNAIRLEVTNAQNVKQQFSGENQFVYYDKAFTIPYGIEFKALQETKKGNTGFVQNVLSYETVAQEGKQPVLDLRLVRDCSFSDNGDQWFGDWTIYFDVVGNENYQSQSSQPYGNKWSIALVLLAANKEQAKSTRAKITQACIDRSKNVNALKAAAISTGNNYYTLYDIQLKKAQSLEQQVKLGQDQKNVLNSVQSEQSLKTANIQKAIQSNSDALNKAVADLKATQQQASGAQKDVEAQNKALEEVKNSLSQISQSQSAVAQQIASTQSQLNEAVNLSNQQKDQAAQLAASQQKIQASAESEKAELARLVKAQEDRMAQLKADFEAQQKALEAQQNAVNQASQAKQAELAKQSQSTKSQQDANAQALQQTQAQIENLLAQVNLQQQQAAAIDAQRKDTEKSVAQMQEILEQKRSAADQLAAKQSIQEAFQAQQDKNLAAAKQNGDKVLAEIAAKAKAELDKLDQSNKEVQAAQAAAKKASDDVNQAYLAFNTAINNVNANCKPAQGRTQLALERVSVNRHAEQLQAIISNSGANIKRRMLRLAQQKKAMQRLAKLFRKQARKVRLQRMRARKHQKNNKNKRQHKQHKKQN